MEASEQGEKPFTSDLRVSLNFINEAGCTSRPGGKAGHSHHPPKEARRPGQLPQSIRTKTLGPQRESNVVNSEESEQELMTEDYVLCLQRGDYSRRHLESGRADGAGDRAKAEPGL